MGENGAGKSTLLKVLAGAHKQDSGEIVLDGRKVEIGAPHRSQELGIAMIYQEFNLVPDLSVAENIFLGREPHNGPFVNKRRTVSLAKEVLSELGLEIDPKSKLRSLGVAQRQMVEIAKAFSQRARIIVMDEPSAALTQHDLAGLYSLTSKLRSEGKAILYVTHRMDEVFELADRVTVLRDGKYVSSCLLSETTESQLIKEMVGREIVDQYPQKEAELAGQVVARFEHVTTLSLRGVSFELRTGEILGIGGLVGSGRSAIGRAFFGVDEVVSGEIQLRGLKVNRAKPSRMIRSGVGMATEDRKLSGLVMSMNIRQNSSLASLNSISTAGFLHRRSERTKSEYFKQSLDIHARGIEQNVRTLSGGNQQKVVLARWLWRDSDVLIVDEPTRGVDVGAKAELYQLLRNLAASGKAILMITSDLPELLGMSDRILIMRDGHVAGELSPENATQEDLIRLAMLDADSVHR